MSQGMPRVSGSHWKLEEARKSPSLEPSEGVWPCPRLDFWPPAVVCVGFSKPLSVLWQAWDGESCPLVWVLWTWWRNTSLCCCISALGGLAAVGHEACRLAERPGWTPLGRICGLPGLGPVGGVVCRGCHTLSSGTLQRQGGVFKGSLQGGRSEGGIRDVQN